MEAFAPRLLAIEAALRRGFVRQEDRTRVAEEIAAWIARATSPELAMACVTAALRTSGTGDPLQLAEVFYTFANGSTRESPELALSPHDPVPPRAVRKDKRIRG